MDAVRIDRSGPFDYIVNKPGSVLGSPASRRSPLAIRLRWLSGDVDRAKQSNEQVAFGHLHDTQGMETMLVVELTQAWTSCAIVFATGTRSS
jgi:hypothetical protein